MDSYNNFNGHLDLKKLIVEGPIKIASYSFLFASFASFFYLPVLKEANEIRLAEIHSNILKSNVDALKQKKKRQLELILKQDNLVYLNKNMKPLKTEVASKLAGSAYKLKTYFNLHDNELAFAVLGSEQKAYSYFVKDSKIFLESAYSISTGFGGFDSVSNKGCTPYGVLRVYEKLGDGAEIGTVFVSNGATKKIVEINNDPTYSGKAHMTTRLIKLEGVEDFNSNTLSRKIFCHGTDVEGKLGKPVSLGCIRFYNEDIIKIHDKVIPKKTLINIIPSKS